MAGSLRHAGRGWSSDSGSAYKRLAESRGDIASGAGYKTIRAALLLQTSRTILRQVIDVCYCEVCKGRAGMKALILSVKRRKLLKALIGTVPLASTRKDEALEWLTYGGNDANPFEVFDPHEKELIIEALERTVVAYRQEGVFGEVERIKGFEAIVRLARAALVFV